MKSQPTSMHWTSQARDSSEAARDHHCGDSRRGTGALVYGSGVQIARESRCRICRVQNHLSYLPHSGAVFPKLEKELAAYSKSVGALHFAIDEPLPKEIVEKLIKVRISMAFPT